MKKLLSLILISITIFSCDSTDSSDNNLVSVEKYFPLKIGNKWEYSFNTEGEYAVIERILKNNFNHEDGSSIWGYTEAVKVIIPDPNEPISGYYTFKTDGLYFYSSEKDTIFTGTNILCRKQLLIKSPVNVGTQWETNDGALCRIASISNYKVLDTNYPNTVLVISEQNQSVDSTWYSFDVGLVKRVFNIGIGTQYPSTTRWELRNYSIL